MKKNPSQSRIKYAVIGFLIMVAVVFIVNRYMIKGILETEKQIKHFQSQSRIDSEPLKSLSAELGSSPQSIRSTASPKATQPLKSKAEQQKTSDDVIFEPALDSIILVQ